MVTCTAPALLLSGLRQPALKSILLLAQAVMRHHQQLEAEEASAQQRALFKVWQAGTWCDDASSKAKRALAFALSAHSTLSQQ